MAVEKTKGKPEGEEGQFRACSYISLSVLITHYVFFIPVISETFNCPPNMIKEGCFQGEKNIKTKI